MDRAWLISYVALWIVVLLLCAVVLAHSRLLGILHQRLAPSSARPLAEGPAIGARVGDLAAERVNGGRWVWSFPAPRDLCLVFISPQCATCDELLPHVADFAREAREARECEVVLVSVLGDPGMNRAYVAYRRLEALTYVLGELISDDLDVQGTPYALRLNREGIVTSKGLVNHYEHLASLAAG